MSNLKIGNKKIHNIEFGDIIFKIIIKSGIVYTLNLSDSYDYDCTVDWGDGSKTKISNSSNVTHTYANNGKYIIKIKGKFESLNLNDNFLTEIISWGDPNITNLKLINCSNSEKLTTLPNESGGLKLITKFNNTFKDCLLLKSIPSGLFDYNTTATSFSGTFSGDTALTGPAPKLWDDDNITIHDNCFSNTGSLGSSGSNIPTSWGGSSSCNPVTNCSGK